MLVIGHAGDDELTAEEDFVGNFVSNGGNQADRVVDLRAGDANVGSSVLLVEPGVAWHVVIVANLHG